MSRWQFEIPTRAEAEAFLEWRRRESVYQTDEHANTIVCQRRLLPVTSPEERAEAKRIVDIKKSAGDVHA